jgi:hypothetical protein
VEPRDPHQHHTTALAARKVTEARLGQRDRRLSYARLLLVVVFLAVAWGAFSQGAVSGWWLLIPSAAFVILIRIHDRVVRSYEAASRAVEWYERGLARLEDRWAGSGETGARFIDDAHPYSNDLDLFGNGSLFQLLSTAQTTTGEETLAAWLLHPADPPTIRARQAAVDDLASRPQLLEDLYTLGFDARRNGDSTSPVRWATAPNLLNHGWLRIAAPLLGGGFVLTVAAWSVGTLPGVVPLTVLLVNALLGLALYRSVSQVLHGSSEPSRELVILAALLGRLRAESYAADRLRQLKAVLEAERAEPLLAVRQLDRLVQMHDWQHNMFFAPIAAAVLWGVQCAAGIEAWRRRHGRSVEGWLDVVGEFEAAAALAMYRFEHPDHPFPELVERTETEPPVFDAEQLAHPLLAHGQAVANDLHLGASPQLMVVSGSNMSGKTTLLRTVGVNGALALAGAPVRAKTLRLSPVAIGGTLRVQDSLIAGRSRFYAEILRVKHLVEIARGSVTLLFLMDELFHGTNSHDRVEGAHGVLEYLVDLGAVGMVTTHDLALAAIGDRLGPRAVNVHFEDQMVGGELSFDYRLRPGNATHGNALALMHAVGLDVVDVATTSRGGPSTETDQRRP